MTSSINPPAENLSPGSVVRNIWEIYREHAGALLPLAVGLFAVQFVLALLLSGALGLLLALLFWILSTFYQGTVVELVRDIQDGRRDSSVGDLVRSVQPVVVPLMVVSLLCAIGIGIGFVLIIIPGLILLTVWSVVAPVTVLEHPGVLAAFGRSRELVRGHGWEVFGVIVLVFLAVMVVSILAALLADPLGSLGRALIQWAVNVVLAPVTALAASVLYFRLRDAHGEPPISQPSPAAPPFA